MRVYKLKAFARFQRRERIINAALAAAVSAAEQGLIDADLGGGLIKQRIARPGRGKSAGYRTIIAYRRGGHAVFLYGFAKNDRANLDDDELALWREIGHAYLGMDDAELAAALVAEDLMENDDGG